jgi:hypothetical protein
MNETTIEEGREQRLQSLAEWTSTEVMGIRMTVEQNLLQEALSKFQGELATVKKDSVGDRKHGYPSLGALLEAANPILAANGLSMSQMLTNDEAGTWLVTLLGHASGQWRMSRMKLAVQPMPGRQDIDMQALGSATTYARRYGGFAMLGVAPDEDDDGKGANAPMQGRTAVRSTFDDRRVPPPPPAEMPRTTDTSSTNPPVEVDQRWFGDHSQGSIVGWVHRVWKVKDGLKKNGQPWVLSGVQLVTGEEFRTFSTGDAESMAEAAKLNVGVHINWKREKKDGYDDSFAITQISPLQADQIGPRTERTTTFRNTVTVRHPETAAFVGARVITDAGRFGTGNEKMLEQIVPKENQEWIVVFNVTPRGRDILEIRSAQDDGPTDNGGAGDPADQPTAGPDAEGQPLTDADIPF